MWSDFMAQWNGTSFFLDSNVTHAADFDLFTDAASTVGFGGFFQGRWFQGAWPDNLDILGTDKLSMALLEIYPIVVSAHIWGHLWQRKRILFHCDNISTVQIIRKRRSKSPMIMKLLRRLTWISAQYCCEILAEYVPGKDNLIADALSRFQMDKFWHLAPAAEKTPHPCPVLEELIFY
jgi:hypothetical protein